MNRPKQFVAANKNAERIKLLAMRGVKLFSNPNILFEIYCPYVMFGNNLEDEILHAQNAIKSMNNLFIY